MAKVVNTPFIQLFILHLTWRICQNWEIHSGAILVTKLQILLGFYQFAHECSLSIRESHPGHSLFMFPQSSPIWKFLSLSLFFMIWALVKSTDEAFCRLSLDLGLMFFSWLGFSYGFERRIPQRRAYCPSCILPRGLFVFVNVYVHSILFDKNRTSSHTVFPWK